jgi:hypothetical protein
MMNVLRILLLLFPAVCALVGASGTQPQILSLYVSALDKNNNPITDVRRADFDVKVDGRHGDVLSVNPAASRLKVAAIVSDLGTGMFQASLGRFVQQLRHGAEIAIIRTVFGPERLVDYSADLSLLAPALRRLGPMGQRGEYGSLLIDTIDDVAREAHSKGTRRAIVVLRIGGESGGLSPDGVREHLMQSGAILYVMSAPGSDPLPDQAGLSSSQVLNDGAWESGGRHEQVVSNTMMPSLERLANELLHQYVVDVRVSGELKPGAKVSISTKRKGIVFRTASRISPTS